MAFFRSRFGRQRRERQHSDRSCRLGHVPPLSTWSWNYRGPAHMTSDWSRIINGWQLRILLSRGPSRDTPRPEQTLMWAWLDRYASAYKAIHGSPGFLKMRSFSIRMTKGGLLPELQR